MNHSHDVARAFDTRGPLPTTVILLALLAPLAACQPEPTPEPGDTSTTTSPFSLSSAEQDPDLSTDPSQGRRAFVGVLTTASALGSLDFRYDAYVVTARQSGDVSIQSDVIHANPSGYRHGYGYPLSMAAIEDGITLSAYGGNYVQNALETGTAIIQYPVVAGRQYILVYKTFGSFTPLTYRLTLPATVTLEGRIHELPEPVSVPTSSTGPITLDNPRPDSLSRFMTWLGERVHGR
jgi:hypothetical protein